MKQLRQRIARPAEVALRSGAATRLLGALGGTPAVPDRLVVLTYHRVTDQLDDGRYPGLVSATPETFAEHLRLLAARSTLVSIDDVLAALSGERPLPPRALLLTFDDAVDDFHDHVLPVLRRTGSPAVVFVPTGYVGAPDSWFWWDALHAAVTRTDAPGPLASPVGVLPLRTADDRLAAYRRLRTHCLGLPTDEARELAMSLCDELGVVPPSASVMGWDALREATASGLVRCCAHTRTHPHLDQLSAQDVHDEIVGSLDDLRRELGASLPVFAYPAGRHSPEVVDVTRAAGVDIAFTTERGANVVGRDDPLRFRRFNVGRRYGLGGVFLQTSPLADRLVRR